MSQQPKKKNIKLTHIPISIQVGNNLGIVNFTTQKYQQVLEKPSINVKNIQQEISYKNAIVRESDSEDEDDEYVRKKVIASNRVTIKPQNIKKRYFRVDIPIPAKGQPVGVKQLKQKINFVIQFNQNNKGNITFIDDVFDSQVEITNVDNQANMSERIKLQDARMDARRKEEKIEVDQKKQKEAAKKKSDK